MKKKERDFKLNIEANHATLAGHTFEHELRIAAINNISVVMCFISIKTLE